MNQYDRKLHVDALVGSVKEMCSTAAVSTSTEETKKYVQAVSAILAGQPKWARKMFLARMKRKRLKVR